ncbi:hypothetical protein ACH5RR_033136 [Cinchona calisaya]|uniref:Bet v I/Major latex protein domain-containing protein n=1 Tax=Cinchona calisaya TaxID=153742 RepID=A0ABD2YMD7_9GENT
MAATTFTAEYTYSIPPARLFKAQFLTFTTCFQSSCPKLSKALKSSKAMEVIFGFLRRPSRREHNGEKSKWISQFQGKSFNYLKYYIDELNEETYTYNYTLIEGDALSDKLEKITYEVKFEPTANGGTIFKMTSNYYPKEDMWSMKKKLKLEKRRLLACTRL